MARTAALAVIALALATTGFTVEVREGDRPIPEYPQGSVTRDEGLANWQTFYEVASHPRCSNCHVGADHRPMWSGPSYGRTRPHGMNIMAGASRIGAEALGCASCHSTLKADDPSANETPHAPPRVAQTWALAPVEAEWFGKSSAYICNQLKDPDRNGGRTIGEVAAHVGHDKVLRWAWNPGGDREPAPHSLEAVTEALMKWAAAGTPCPQE